MPPLKPYNEANPTMLPGMDAVMVDYITDSGNHDTRISDYVPKPGSGYEILTDDVLNSGNLGVLRKFQHEHHNELNEPENAPAKKYMEARIKTAEKLDLLEKKKKFSVAQGKMPPKLSLDTKGGFIGFSTIKYPDYQTSANGCWSASYSLLLKSRGVDLSQEEIRQWRPDYPEGTEEKDKANFERKRLMNTDRGNAIYPNADLAGKVLPNTAVNMIRIEPFETEQFSINQMPLNKTQLKAVQKEYLAQVKSNLQQTIINALTVHRSPVAVNWDGHFVTITGISKDGKTLRYEESRGAETGAKRTRTMSVNELVKQTMSAHTHNGQYYARGGGVELTWLSDLPVQEYGNPVQPPIDPKNGDYLQIDENGKLTVDVPLNASGVSSAGRPAEGQVNGKGIERGILLDQSKLSAQLGGQQVNGWGADFQVMLGTSSTYYPDRIVRPKDPSLIEEVYEEQEEIFSDLEDMCQSIIMGIASIQDVAMAEKALAALRCLRSQAEGGKDKAPADQEDEHLDEKDKELLRIENGDPEKAKEHLKNLCDYLCTKPGKNEKTRYESLFINKSERIAEKYIKSLKSINFLLDLGKEKEAETLEATNEKMQAEYQKQKALMNKRIREERAFKNKIENYWAVAKTYATGSVLDSPERREMLRALALITANVTLHQQMVEKGIEPPYPSEKEVNDLVPKVEESKAFGTVTTGVRPWVLDPDSKVEDFIKELDDEEREIRAKEEAIERYAVPEEKLERIQKRAGKLARILDDTKTGSYTGLDIISRSENSGKFEKAKTAIRNFSTSEDPSARDVKKACDIVLAYLDGKEKRRNREFGRIRWNACMTFLASTMPRDKFETYCKRVNEIRGVGPESKDYVGPENYYTTGTTMRSIMNDSRDRIERGAGTLRDYARIIAVRDLGDDGGVFVGRDRCDSKTSKHLLRVRTDAVLNDPRFKDFIEQMDDEQLTQMMEDDANDLSTAWDSHKELNPIGKEKGKTAEPESDSLLSE